MGVVTLFAKGGLPHFASSMVRTKLPYGVSSRSTSMKASRKIQARWYSNDS